MLGKRNKARDAFTFSLGGMTAKIPFVIAPAVADDRINKIRDEQIKQVRDSAVLKSGTWQRLRRQPA